MRHLIAFLLALLSLPSQADTIGLHLGSVHSEPGFNNVNIGAYYRADNGATVGAYCNTESRSARYPHAKACQIAAYAGYTASAGPVSLTVGVITGYTRGTMPMAVPSVEYKGWRIAYIPRIDPKSGAHVLHLMKEF